MLSVPATEIHRTVSITIMPMPWPETMSITITMMSEAVAVRISVAVTMKAGGIPVSVPLSWVSHDLAEPYQLNHQ
ncbi:MAG TPA: hypothetical protein VK564_12775 [Thermodesulfobacteriota bacterium]|nr:hypothetical protein [Thermodesulfobacteriota bacterium]